MLMAKAEFAEGSNDAYCSVGMLQEKANGNYNLRMAAQDVLLAHLRKEYGNVVAIPSWNDAKERTIDEVREAFLMAAKELRNKE
jgi:hypothetical protein